MEMAAVNSNQLLPIYDLAISARVSWQAHSLNNIGTNGSNRLMPRRQMLADGTETDACSGNIAKHYHAVLEAEYLAALGVSFCPACAERDGRRVAALVDRPEYKNITIAHVIGGCGLCDSQGFMSPAKNATPGTDQESRQKLTKNTVIDFGYILALPGRSGETSQLNTRSGTASGEGQMLMKKTIRSGDYALGMRYGAVGIGMDTYQWRMIVHDPEERRRRHQAVLSALRDWFMSPDGALTGTAMPHLTGLQGAITIRTEAARAPMWSALQDDFIQVLAAMAGPTCQVITFTSPVEFQQAMESLITGSIPAVRVEQKIGQEWLLNTQEAKSTG